mgnify:FL=1
MAEFNKGLADVGEPIKYRLITKWYEWEGIATRKMISLMLAIMEKGAGASLMYQIDNRENWEMLSPSLEPFVTYLDKNTKKFHRIRFKVAGVTSYESFVFLGLEIAEGVNEGITKHG